MHSLKGIVYCVLCIAYCASGCAPQPSEDEEFSFTGVPRLAKYYPEVDENGDTTYAIPPAETFINQDGDSFSTAALKGHISVVQIFFASCQGICPVISNNMAVLQKDFFHDDVKLLSVSVDPERDSVAALKAYSQSMHATQPQWMFVSGDKKKTYDLIRYGFRLPDIEPGTGDEEDFIHSDQLMLMDREGIIRGYYGGTDTAQVNLLREDIATLLKEK